MNTMFNGMFMKVQGAMILSPENFAIATTWSSASATGCSL